jgi:FkbM family methyltransferase
VNLYGQDAEVQLLRKILPKLSHRSVVDVGAERGNFARALLDAGADEIHVAEPEPRNVEFLRERFGGEPRVTIHECAISSEDGEADLHLSMHPSGAPMTFGHTLTERPEARDIAWRDTIQVNVRSLGSLVAAAEIPRRIGILKVDTEGHDLAVVAGLGELDCDVIMTEHWLDLPNSLGPCPWTTAELGDALSARGFHHFAFFVHRDEFTVVQWDDGTIPAAHFGNLVFLHDRVLDGLLPDVLESASELGRNVSTSWVSTGMNS